MRKINHNFMSSEPDNQPIRQLSEQQKILAPVEPQYSAAVEPVRCYWNTTVILAELKCDMSSYLFRRKF